MEWVTGRVVAHHYEETGLPLCPYQVQLECGRLIYAPKDDDEVIKKTVFAASSKEKFNKPSACDRRMAPSWAMSAKNLASCVSGCLSQEDYAFMKNVLARWKSRSVLHEKDLVDLADDSVTEFMCGQSEAQFAGKNDAQNSDREASTRMPCLASKYSHRRPNRA